MTATPTDIAAPAATRVHRIEVRPKPGEFDAAGASLLSDAKQVIADIAAVHAGRIYLIEAPLSDGQAQQVADELLADPINQAAALGSAPVADSHALIEVHYLPGVMDPVAQSTREAILEMLPGLSADQIDVRTGFRYDLEPASAETPDPQQVKAFAERYLSNPVVQSVHFEAFLPESFPHGERYDLNLTHVPIRDLDDEALMKMSREAHLFLSLAEMQAVRDYYRSQDREPTDIELETFAQTWSEHCVHKTLKSTVHYAAGGDESPVPGATAEQLAARPGHEVHEDGSVTIHNLLKSTVAAATFKLMEQEPHKSWCVSVFEDNAGIVKLDDGHGVCIKVETHNHPSAIEPYGGAATGIGGCIRDVIGTGLAALPIANTDTFCVAEPDTDNLPKGVIHPRRILKQVVAGVRDYGNRMGIPTLNGAVYFHEDFLGNPLVFAGCVGLMPLDRCFGSAQPGDRIIVLGGATGRDGIHGATFSSAELTDTHADEFSHAVQIGNPITEKKTLDVIIQARDYEGGPLFSAITDCGAGGYSSAVGEMGEKVGAFVQLENAPLKYNGLSYTEIWISEAQERMVLAVPEEKVATLKAMCDAEDVPMCDLGSFGHYADGEGAGEPVLILTYHGTEVGRLNMPLLHDGIPTPTRSAARKLAATPAASPADDIKLDDALLKLLGHPNIASKHWIIRQYDHEVQGGSVVKPLVGPVQDGPSDAAVIRPKLGSSRGVALSCGMAPHLAEKAIKGGIATDGDSYWATLAAIDEAVRNAVCVGADPGQIAILDNFCWPSCDDPHQLATLVRAAEACYDGAVAYQTPFVSGKDSLNNQFTTEDGQVITIPQTLLVSAMGIVPDVTKCLTMDAKAAGNALLVVGNTTADLGGSHLAMTQGLAGTIPKLDIKQGPASAKAVATLIAGGLVRSAHDCSDGGLLVAAAEMAFAGRIGLDLDLTSLPATGDLGTLAACFAETPSRYLLEVAPEQLDAVIRSLRDVGLAFGQIGSFASHGKLTVRTGKAGQLMDVSLDALREAWQAPLNW